MTGVPLSALSWWRTVRIAAMPRDNSTPEEMTASRPARVARQKLVQHERYLSILRMAYRTRRDAGLPLGKLLDSITQAENELAGLSEAAGGRIVDRRRPKKIDTDARCTVYVDECGSHNMTSSDAYQAFVLAAVIIPDDRHRELDRKWKNWKKDYLGGSHKKAHEPDIRHRRKSFWCGGSEVAQDRAIAGLSRWLGRTDFAALACVINRPEYRAEVGAKALDESLPENVYMMSIHFLAERVALVLYNQFQGATGRLVVESRGPMEDAKFQYEFTRLFFDGTSYVSATMFRHQLEPGIDFLTKEDNSTGLQLADLIARPCGEKVIDPQSTPDRWPDIREKLCPGEETAHSILGLKIVPWDDSYGNIWKS